MGERFTDDPNEEKALEWWNSLILEEQHNEVYHFCTGNDISTMEFTVNDIIEIWTRKDNK